MDSAPCRQDGCRCGWPAALGHSWLHSLSRGKTSAAIPRLGGEYPLAASHESVSIGAALPFCFVLNNPALGIETCQELRALTEQVGRSRAINFPGIHAVVNAGEEQAAHKRPCHANPDRCADKHPAASCCLTQYFFK